MLLHWFFIIVLKISFAFCGVSVSRSRVLRQVGSTGPTCRNPNNEIGICINIKKCQSLLDLVLVSGRKPDVGNFLRQSQCGYENSTPKVCCPNNAASNNVGSNNVAITKEDCGKSEKKDTKIVGGQNATKDDWPWMAAIGYRTPTNPGPDFKCGATLISSKYVITAAHCVSELTGGLQVTLIRLGDLNLNPNVDDGLTPIDVPVADIIVHPQYSVNPNTKDIALIRLANDIQFTKYIHPICLLNGPEYRRDEYYITKRPFIVGWGALRFRGPIVTQLQYTTINVVDNKKCAQMYKNQKSALINEKVLCAGEPGKDACQGDSGGPLIFPNATEDKFYLGGIVSYGVGCANPDYPGVYTRVAEYIDWIKEVTQEAY